MSTLIGEPFPLAHGPLPGESSLRNDLTNTVNCKNGELQFLGEQGCLHTLHLNLVIMGIYRSSSTSTC